MPETWASIREIVTFLCERQVSPVTLLVVPGRDWQSGQIDELREMTRAGMLLAGHGWLHETHRFGGLYHRLHSLCLSRRAAEHLALSDAAICELIHRCFAWFTHHALPPPELYVAPAWAMGFLKRRTLSGLPFRYYEYLNGVFDSDRGRFRHLPLTGYQADRAWRIAALRLSNSLNVWYAQHAGQDLRIAIHPEDLDLPLAHELDRTLSRCDGFAGYADQSAM